MASLQINKDPRLPKSHTVIHTEDSSTLFNYAAYPPSSQSSSQCQYQINIAEGSGVSRRIMQHMTGVITLTLNETAPQFNPETYTCGLSFASDTSTCETGLDWAFSLSEYPLSKICMNVNVNMNKGLSSINLPNLPQTTSAYARYLNPQTLKALADSGTAAQIDRQMQYYDAADVSGCFVSPTQVGRSDEVPYPRCSKIKNIVPTYAFVSGTTGPKYIKSVKIYFDFVEQICAGPFCEQNDYREAVYGISVLSVNLQYVPNPAVSLIKAAFVAPDNWSPNVPGYSFLNAYLMRLASFTSSVEFTRQELLLGQIRAPSVPKYMVYSYTDPQFYSYAGYRSPKLESVNITGDANKSYPSTQLMSQVIDIGTVPRGYLIWVNRVSGVESYGTAEFLSSPDQFLPISNLTVNITGQGPVLVQMTAQQLYDLCQKNGANVTCDEFLGSACVQDQCSLNRQVEGQPQPYMMPNSSPIFIKSTDLGLPKGVYPGSNHRMSMSFQVQCFDTIKKREIVNGQPVIYFGDNQLFLNVAVIYDKLLEYNANGGFTSYNSFDDIKHDTIEVHSRQRKHFLGGSLSDIIGGIGDLFSGNLSGMVQKLPGALETSAQMFGLGTTTPMGGARESKPSKSKADKKEKKSLWD